MAMTSAGRKIRDVSVAALDATIRFGSDGSIYMRSTRRLGPYLSRITERLEYWADRTPARIFLAQRGEDGGWRTATYAEALTSVRNLAQALVDRGLSRDRPVAILS